MQNSEVVKLLDQYGFLDMGFEVKAHETSDDQTKKTSFVLSNRYVTIDIRIYSNGVYVSVAKNEENWANGTSATDKENVPRKAFFLEEFLKQKIKYSDEDVDKILKPEKQKSHEDHDAHVIGNLARIFRNHLMPAIEGKEWPDVHLDWSLFGR